MLYFETKQHSVIRSIEVRLGRNYPLQHLKPK